MRSIPGISTLILLVSLFGCDSGVSVTPVTDADVDTGTNTDSILEPVIGAAIGSASDVGQWGAVMPWPHVAVSMANLPDGRILTYSGSERRTWPIAEQTYSATWNPDSGAFIENLHQGHNMFCAALSSTSDGRVLVNGGRNGGNSPWTTLFDYRDNDWHQVQNMASGGRWYPTTISMGDGKVMTALGSSSNTRNPDLWDPGNGWRVLNGIDFLDMRTRNNERGRDNSWPLLSLAPNGNIYHYWDTVENQMINASGNGSSREANPTTDGVNHAGGIQVMYDEGKLLISGRNDGSWGGNAAGPESNAFTVDLNGSVPNIRGTANMAHKRKYHQLIPLPTGEVLVVGGNTTGAKFRDSGSVLEPEIWNPQSGTWRGMANMAVPRDYHSTALLLTDGRVLTAGGGYGGGDHQDGQVFSPPYLFNGNALATRPTVVSDQGIADTGTEVDVTTSGNIAYFSFIRMSATTHAMNTDSRFYKPQFQANGANKYKVSIHENPNVATPGYWMLFAVDNNGVPSKAQVIKITALDTRLSNLALFGTASHSSTFPSALDFEAGNANDGDLSGGRKSGSLTHTNNENQAWWEIDLGRSVEIDTVRLWNRTDCCSNRLNNFHVLVSNTPFASTDLATTIGQSGVSDYHNQGTAGRQTDLSVNRVGRYVRVQLADVGILQLAEVQVFGSRRTDLTNLAQAGTATQSSNYNNNPVFFADIANNGQTDGNAEFTHTNNDNNSWWELDLGQVMEIDSVVLWNRTNCCSNRLSDFYVFTSDTPFNSKDLQITNSQTGVTSRFFQGAAGNTEEITIGTTGRYVRVQLSSASEFLSLAEVQVMGAGLPVPLEVQSLTNAPQQQGATVSLSASALGSGSLQYQWNFGDGSSDTGFSTDPAISHTYAQPGRYVVSLTVRAANGDEVRENYTQIIHSPVLASKPVSSSSVIEHSTRAQLWNVNPDNNTVSVISTDTYALLAEIAVESGPVSLAEAPNGDVWVTNRYKSTISVINSQSFALISSISLQRASQPYGILFDGANAYVALEAVGKVVKFSAAGAQLAEVDVGDSPRHLALDTSQQRLYVSRFITPLLPGEDTANPVVDDGTRAYGGEVVVLGSANLQIQDTIILEHANKVASEHEGPGVPNYLGAPAISPAGGVAWIPSKQDNILGGELRGGDGITFDQTVRAISSKVDLTSNTEIISDRIDHDNASISASSVFDPFGVTLFTALEGNRQISVIDVSTAIEVGRFDTGRAPQGMTVSLDGKKLYVHNFMDRSIGIYDIEGIVTNGATTATELATVKVVANEALDAIVLRGKQLFYDSRDDRLAGLDYMSCASCHVDGEHDGRVWDFTGLGEGLRNTISLKGRSGMGHGVLHWTGNFDELQDFEGQIRDFAGGTGLMNDADFAMAQEPLGNPKAGLSSDLDALSAYMTSLTRVDNSPWRAADGSMTAPASIGAGVFTAKGCDTCHAGTIFTDSPTAALHDIGSLMPESGNRLGAALTGLDTPTLQGVWADAPYLHDGSASTLQEAVAAHINITTTVAEQNDLAEFLAQLDDSAVMLPPPPVVVPANPPPSTTFTNAVADGAITVNGTITDWAALGSFGTDADDATGNNTIDWREAWFAHDNANFYVAYSNDQPIVESWGYAIYIDVDGNKATGFNGFAGELPIGADYLLEGRDLQSYTGVSNDWSWRSDGVVSYQANGTTAEAAIPRAMLGNTTTLRLYFHGDNGAVNGTTLDHFPDAVTDPLAADAERYFTYSIVASNGNASPIAVSQNVVVAQGASLDLILLGSDIDGDTLSYEVTDQPANGTISGNPPNIIYTPNANYAGTDSLTFTVSDGSATSSAATIAINVSAPPPSNEATIVVDGNLADWSATAAFGVDPLDANGLNDSIDWVQGWVAHDNQSFYLAYQNESAVTLGWGYGIYIDTDNDISTGFTGFVGEYPVGVDYLIEGDELQRYTGTGQNWSWSAVATLNSGVAGSNAEIEIPRSSLGNPTQLQLFFVGENAAVNGPTVDYYPDNAVNNGSPVRFFSYAVEAAANSLPVATGMALSTGINTALNFVLAGTDVDGDSLSFQITRQPASGSLSGTPPNVIYTPGNNFSGVDTLAFRVSDSMGGSDPAIVSINVGNNNGIISNSVSSIDIDGDLSDWNGLAGFDPDANDIGTGTEQIDWRQAWMAHNASTLYMALQNDTTISVLSYGHAVYLDTDAQAATGFRGFSGEYATGTDFLLEGTDLYKYAGSGNNWLWTYIATVPTAVVGGIAEYAIPRALLGGSSSIDVYWRGDNGTINGSGVDLYPDAVTDTGAAVNARRFRYSM